MKTLLYIWVSLIILLIAGFWYMNNEINRLVRVSALSEDSLQVTAKVPYNGHNMPVVRNYGTQETYDPQQAGHNE